MKNLSTAQKLVKFFSSKEKFERMKQDSMKWGFTCESCSERTCLWDLGGIRYKAKGDPRLRIRCPKCKKMAMQKIFYLEENSNPQETVKIEKDAIRE